jgi:hypothetical protein
LPLVSSSERASGSVSAEPTVVTNWKKTSWLFCGSFTHCRANARQARKPGGGQAHQGWQDVTERLLGGSSDRFSFRSS